MTVEIVDVSSGRVEVIELGPRALQTAEVIGVGGRVQRLDDLSDVDDADAGITGQALVRQPDGQYRPATLAAAGGPAPALAYSHDQGEPSTVWLIGHGLGFLPSGIDVRDHVGNVHYPLVSWPDAATVRLDFNDSVRGTARLS